MRAATSWPRSTTTNSWPSLLQQRLSDAPFRESRGAAHPTGQFCYRFSTTEAYPPRARSDHYCVLASLAPHLTVFMSRNTPRLAVMQRRSGECRSVPFKPLIDTATCSITLLSRLVQRPGRRVLSPFVAFPSRLRAAPASTSRPLPSSRAACSSSSRHSAGKSNSMGTASLATSRTTLLARVSVRAVEGEVMSWCPRARTSQASRVAAGRLGLRPVAACTCFASCRKTCSGSLPPCGPPKTLLAC